MYPTEAGAAGGGIDLEEMGVGRQARMKRFSLELEASGSSSSSSGLHGDEGFLQPVIGSVSGRHESPLHVTLSLLFKTSPGKTMVPTDIRPLRAAATARPSNTQSPCSTALHWYC
jgi:hypothetical protein